MDTMTDLERTISQKYVTLAGFLDAYGDRIWASPVYDGGYTITFYGLGDFRGKTFMDCVEKAYKAWEGGAAIVIEGPIKIRHHYRIMPLRSIEEVRELFGADSGTTDWDLNWLFLSTSGVHGSYRSLDDIEKGWDLPEDHDDCCGREITILVVMPRVVLMKWGSVEIEKEDIGWLRNAATRTLEGVAQSAEGNLVPTGNTNRYVLHLDGGKDVVAIDATLKAFEKIQKAIGDNG